MSEVPKGEAWASGIFDAYLGDFTRRGKEKTPVVYHKLLSQFSRWWGEREGLLDRDDVLKFLEERRSRARPWSNSTCNLFLTALRGWAKFSRGYAEDGREQARLSRIEGIGGYTSRRGEKPALSLEQISTLFDAMDPDASSLFWILLWFGFRVGELKLIHNIDWEAGKLTVETEKVGGSRSLFFDGYTARILRHAHDNGLLDLPDIKIWKMLRRYSGYCAPAKLTPHVCRHTFATRFSTITDRDTLRRMLGHGPRETTDIYVHRSDEQLRKVMVARHYLKPLEPKEANSASIGGVENGA